MKELLPGVGNIYITFLKVLTGVFYLPFKGFFFVCLFVCLFLRQKRKRSGSRGENDGNA